MRSKSKLTIALTVWVILSLLLSEVAYAMAPANEIVARSDAGLFNQKSADFPSQNVVGTNSSPSYAPTVYGRVLFAPAIDLDNDPATNPVPGMRAPVLNVFGELNGLVTLAAQLEPEDKSLAPISIPIAFHIWNDAGFEYQETVNSDAWGAAVLEVPFTDIEGEFAYQASAPGYASTEVRHFQFDPSQAKHTLHFDGAKLTYQLLGNGRVVFSLQTQAELGADRDSVQLVLARRAPTAISGKPDNPLMPVFEAAERENLYFPFPTIPMTVIAPHTAQVELSLPAGDYRILSFATVNTQFAESIYSQNVELALQDAAQPTGQAVWASDLEYQPGYTLVQYDAPPGQQAFGLVSTEQTPDISPDWEGNHSFVKTTRSGPFTWQQERYDIAVETKVDDGKKTVSLQDFDYDPISRRYTLAIQSLQEQVVTDTLRVDVLGPGGVVIQHEEAQVVLDPDQPFQYTLEVSAALGRPQGLRVVLDDPFEGTIQSLKAAFTTLYNAARSGEGYAEGTIVYFVELLGVSLVQYEYKTPGPGSGWSGPKLSAGLVWKVMKWLWKEGVDAKNARISLGRLGADAAINVGVKFTVDKGKCPDEAALAEIEQRLADLARGLDAQASEFKLLDDSVVTPPIPLFWIITGWGKVRMRIKAKVDSAGLSLKVGGEGKLEVAFHVGLALPISAGDAGFLKTMYKLVTGVNALASIVQGASVIKGWQVPQKDCDDDPPPDPQPPDDRQDAWQGVENFSQELSYTGIRNDLTLLIQRAQEQNLWRAERLLTLRLREIELSEFSTDMERLSDNLADETDIILAARADMDGIISGTMPISPSQTITEALVVRLEQMDADLSALEYAQQQQTLLDALEVAERRYMELNGQELELQAELRQLFSTQTLGVIASGFAEATLSALREAGLPGSLVSPWPSEGVFRGQNAPYLAPELAPRALILPSGGLHLIAGSPEARAWLEAYVDSGGLLVVFSQPFGADWQALPGGQLNGTGYVEEQRWSFSSVKAAMPSNWLVWMGVERPDLQIDGYFTSWPSGAQILLRRTSWRSWYPVPGEEDGRPVMVEYSYGNGTVLATTAYGDWAWKAGYWWGDDWQMTRTVLNRAYLLSQGKDIYDAFFAEPESTVTVSFPVTNTGAMTVTSVTVKLPLHLGWGGDYQVQVPVFLPPGGSTIVNAPVKAPPVKRGVHEWTQVGLYRLRVFANPLKGQPYALAGPFFYVHSPINHSGMYTQLAYTPNPVGLYQSCTVTATLVNLKAVPVTFVLRGDQDLPSDPITLTVPAHGQAFTTYPLLADRSKHLVVKAYTLSGNLLDVTKLDLNIVYPSLKARTVLPERLADGVNLPIQVTNGSALASALEASIAITLTTPSGVSIWNERRDLPFIAAGETITTNFTVNAPPIDELGTYQLAVWVDDGRKLGKPEIIQLPTLAQAVSVGSDALHIRGPMPFNVEVYNLGFFNLNPTLEINVPDAGWSHSEPISLPVGSSWAETYTLTLPISVTSGSHTIHTSIRTSNSITDSVSYFVPPPALKLNVTEGPHIAGETLPFTVTNTGGVDTTLFYTVTLFSMEGPWVLAQETVSGTTILADDSSIVTGSLPIDLASGTYRVSVDGQFSPPGKKIHYERMVLVSGADVQAQAASGPFVAGGILPLTLANHGSVDASAYYGQVYLQNADSLLPLSEWFTETLVVSHATTTIPITIPLGIRSGTYALHVQGEYTPGYRSFTLVQPVQISGTQVTIEVQTDRERYLTVDTITTTAHVTNTGTVLPSGNLGLAIFQGQAVEDWQIYDQDNSGLSSNDLQAVCVDPLGNIWFGPSGSGGGIGKYTEASVMEISDAVINRLSADLQTWQTLVLPPMDGWYYSVNAIDCSQPGSLWLATDDGALRLDTVNGAWQVYRTSNSGISSNYVRDIVVDAQGNAWIGTNMGLSQLTPGNAWYTYTVGTSELPSDWVDTLALGPDNAVWVGTDNGLGKLTPSTGAWVTYTVNNSGLVGNSITGIDFDSRGTPWIATAYWGEGQGGLSNLLPVGEWITYTVSNSGLYNGDIIAFAIDRSDRKWIGFTDNGADRLSSNNVQWDHYDDPLSGNRVNDISISLDGSIWLATDWYMPSGVSEYVRQYQKTGVNAAGYGGATRVHIVGAADFLWTHSFTVTLDSPDAQVYATDLAAATLGGTGQFMLMGVLSSTLGQVLGNDLYPFEVFSTTTGLALDLDRSIYQPGDPVEVTADLFNGSSLPLWNQSITITLNSQVIYQAGPFNVEPGQHYTCTLTTHAPLDVGKKAIVEVRTLLLYANQLFDIEAAHGEASLTFPSSVGYEPFSTTLTVTNTGITEAIIEVQVANTIAETIVLAPGQVGKIIRTVTLLPGEPLVAAVRGDIVLNLSQFVPWGEAARVEILPEENETSGLTPIAYRLTGTGDLPTFVLARVLVDPELAGSPVISDSYQIYPDQQFVNTFWVELPAGWHSVTVELYDAGGRLVDSDQAAFTLLERGNPQVPVPYILGVQSSPAIVQAGETVTVSVDVANTGGTGPVVVGIQLFSSLEQWVITTTAWTTGTFQFVLPVPADLPSDEYYGQVSAAGDALPLLVQVRGSDVKMSLALDEPYYFPGEIAQLTVTLTETAGVSGDYVILARYWGTEDYYTVTLPAYQTTQYTFPFTVTEPGRANVFLSNVPLPIYGQRVLMLDSLPVPVVDRGQGAYLTFDKLVYSAGETVEVTAHVTGTLSYLSVMGPMELALFADDALLWGPPRQSDGLGLIISGTYPLSYQLPDDITTGRYTFLLQVNSQFYQYPVDVKGWKVTTGHVQVDKPRYNQQDTLTAVAEFWNEGTETIHGLNLTAWILPPGDGDAIELTLPISRTMDLLPGLNVVKVSGAFTTSVSGPHRILINLGRHGSGLRVAGAMTQFDVGWAHLVSLNTDHGDYTPGQVGLGRLDLYGYGPTQVVVTVTEVITPLVDLQLNLEGFTTYTFTVPTDAGDYLLVAKSTDQNGTTDQLIHPYAVPEPPDTQAPSLYFTDPVTNTIITTPVPTITLAVSGFASDDSGTVTVLVNGQPVTPTVNGMFTTVITLYQGLNLLSAVAVDPSANITYTEIIPIVVIPDRAIHLSADQSTVDVGDVVTFTVEVTSSGILSDVLLQQTIPADMASQVSVTASTGVAAVHQSGVGPYSITWQGVVPAGQMVTLTIRFTAVRVGRLEQQITAFWGWGLIDTSNPVTVIISDVAPEPRRIYLPIVRK